MEWFEALGLLLGTIVVLMAIGMPVALAFLAANILGAWVFMGGAVGVTQLLNNGFGSLTTFALVPIPLFLLMGEIFFHTGLGARMFNAIDRLLGRLPGRLSYVTVLGGTGFSTEYAAGYGLALLCALTWSGYSVLSRLVGDAPTGTVAVFCLATAALSLPLHLMFEETVWPQSMLGWASVLGLGLGPVGLAFFVWDIGVKRGDIQLLGTSSYAAPLLSTLVLVVAGVAAPSFTLAWAALLITGGALAAARASLRSEGAVPPS